MRRIYSTLLILITLIIVGGVWYFDYPKPPLEKDIELTSNEARSKPIPWEEKIGQLFMIGHWANTPVASTTALIKKYHLGSVLIMSVPDDPKEIKGWIKQWNEAVNQPLFIAIDQEGGVVSRLRGEDFSTTSQRYIFSTTTAYQVGKKRGQELAMLDININLAPVLDRANKKDSFMYKRAFPPHTDHTALAKSMINGFSENGVIGAVKHFPGHPDTTEDSHQKLPTIYISPQKLSDYTADFNALIKNGAIKMLMTAHVLFPEIDDKPATLSPSILTQYLRQELGYQGLILTDDMIMDAIDQTWHSDEASVMALAAGADIIMFAAEPEKVGDAVEAVSAAVSAGRLSPQTLDESYQRISKLKDTTLSHE